MNFSHYKQIHKPYLQKWGKNCAVSPETSCRASLFFQLSTVEVELQRGLFHKSAMHFRNTSMILSPNCWPVCHIVTIKSMTTQSQKAMGQVSGTVVAHLFQQAVLRGWLYRLLKSTCFLVSHWGTNTQVTVCMSSWQWQGVSAKAGDGEAAGPGLPCRLEPFICGGPNRYLIKARPYQQFPHWCLFLNKIIHFQLTWFSQQPRTCLTQELFLSRF